MPLSVYRPGRRTAGDAGEPSAQRRRRQSAASGGRAGAGRLGLAPFLEAERFLGGLPLLDGVEVGAALVGGLVLLDRNAVRVGEGVVADAGHLPGNLHAGLVGADGEAVVRDLPP